MDELTKSLSACHANTFIMYYKAHAFHWNVEGMFFPTYHGFFGDLYEELFGAVDPMAEEIRALGSYAPTSLTELYKNCTLEESTTRGTEIKSMLEELISDNEQIIACLTKTFDLANSVNNQGLADFVAGRLDVHKKHAWMLKSCVKGL